MTETERTLRVLARNCRKEQATRYLAPVLEHIADKLVEEYVTRKEFFEVTEDIIERTTDELAEMRRRLNI